LLVVFWTQLAALVLLGRLLGSAARRLHQPAVIGELIAGLLLGPSVFGEIWPAGFKWFLPASSLSKGYLAAVADLALLVLLIVVGAEADLGLIRRLGKSAGWVTSVSLILPFAAGLAGALALPKGFIGSHVPHDAFYLLIAGAVCISSLPVIARIITDMGLVRRDFAQIAIAAGTVNDSFGFLLVIVATSIAKSKSSLHVALAFVGLVVLSVLLFTLGQRFVDSALREVRRKGPNVAGSLTVSLVAALAVAAGFQAFGIEGTLGGFLVGIVLGRSRFKQGQAMEQLTRFTAAFLSPIFFATAGLRVNLTLLGHPATLLAVVLLTAGAFGAKLITGILSARATGLPWRGAVALGIVLNGKGTLQVIIATAGLSAGIFTQSAYTAVIVMSIISSLAVGPLLSTAIRDWRGSREERSRLEEEERLAANVIVRKERLLLATGGSRSSLLAASVLHHAWPTDLEVTVLRVEPSSQPEDAAGEEKLRGASWLFPGRNVEQSSVSSGDVLAAILAETRLGYGVLGLGASEHEDSERLLSAVVDEVLIRSPIPMIVARRAVSEEGLGADPASPPARILVPVSGSISSRGAQEVAYGLSRSWRCRITLLHVMTHGDGQPGASTRGAKQESPGGLRSRLELLTLASQQHPSTAHRVLAEAENLAASNGVRAHARLRKGHAAGEEIVRFAQESRADLIVLGATARSLEGRPFLGHSVEHVLRRAGTSVVVAVLPADQREPLKEPREPDGSRDSKPGPLTGQNE
jgi:Kef-type K+ transport system membrane component KefB/nucleotide-binding universal stress UspA family protein